MADAFVKFKEYSVAEFFKKNRQMLGFYGKTRSLTTIVHEYVTNSLDACEEHGILPTIKVSIKELGEGNYKVRVEDNGIGIPEKLIGKALGQMLAGTKFHRYIQQRGQQGIGAAGCTMYALLTTGKPVYVESRYKNTLIRCNLSIDFKTNTPIIENVVKEEWNGESGLIVEAEVGDVKYDKGPYGVYEYLKRTAIANPHAEIVLIEPDGNEIIFPRSDTVIPKRPKEVLPHPLGLTVHDLYDFAKSNKEYRTLSAFLQNSFARVSAGKLKELKEILPTIDFSKRPNDLEWDECSELVKAFRKIKWIAPSTDSLVPIGKEQIEKSMKNILNPEFVSVTQRSPKVYRGGIPFSVEAAIAYGGGAGRQKQNGKGGDVMRFSNRVPLLFDAGGCAITEAIKEIDWKRYGIKNFDETPITIFVNFTSVHVPYTGAGKQAISPDEEIVSEIKNAIQEVARSMQKYLSGIVRERERESKKKAVMRYIDQLTKDLTELAGYHNPEELKNILRSMVERKYV